MANNLNIPEAFQGYIYHKSINDIELLKLKNITDGITREEALEELKVFQYIIDNAYSGREYWENNGVDFCKGYEKIEKYIMSHKFILKNDIFNLYYELLQQIHDGHSGLMTYGINVDMGKKYKAYFSDVLLEKKSGKYEIIFSKVHHLAAGMVHKKEKALNQIIGWTVLM